ncbi:hypothetical protein ACFL6D_02910 [Spirochaetota bacterium]
MKNRSNTRLILMLLVTVVILFFLLMPSLDTFNDNKSLITHTNKKITDTIGYIKLFKSLGIGSIDAYHFTSDNDFASRIKKLQDRRGILVLSESFEKKERQEYIAEMKGSYKAAFGFLHDICTMNKAVSVKKLNMFEINEKIHVKLTLEYLKK